MSTTVSCAPPNPKGEKSSNGENPLELFCPAPKPFANSPNMVRKSSSGFTLDWKRRSYKGYIIYHGSVLDIDFYSNTIIVPIYQILQWLVRLTWYSHRIFSGRLFWEKGLYFCCWCWLEFDPNASYWALFWSSLKTSYASEASYVFKNICNKIEVPLQCRRN